MKKQYGFCRTALLLCTWLFSSAAYAEIYSGNCGANGANVTWKLDTETGVLEISGTGAMENYNADVPWYNYRTSITSVTIGKGITTIGSGAFYYCIDLTEITIPNSVTTIGDGAFYCCYGLTSVTIPNSVITIGEGAFVNCMDLTEITIPESVITISDGAFSGSGLKEVWFNADSCISVDFEYCKALTTVHIGENVKRIPGGVFPFCEGLTEITIPNSVIAIGNGAFSGCENLTSVTIGKSVQTIGSFAFSHCSSLTSVTIPESVTTIGDEAFEYCYGLTSVTIGKSVTTIDGLAFYECTSLTEVTAYNPIPVDIVITEEEWDSYSAFDGVHCANCKLYVPKGSVELYKAAEGWKKFGTILPIAESSAITEIQQDAEHIAVYNLQGVPVLETDDAADLKTLQNGAYIVNGKKMIIAR